MLTARSTGRRWRPSCSPTRPPGSRLEQITHPLVREGFESPSQAAAIDAIVVNDIPLLTTLAAAAAFHLVVGVRADAERAGANG